MRSNDQVLASPRLRWWQLGALRRITLVGILAVCFMQYYYMQVLVEIASLPSVVVFVPLEAQPRS